MAAADDTDDLASLFVAVTGRSTVTEPQRDDGRRDGEKASEISTYLHESIRENGLGEAVAEPDPN